MTTRTTTPEIIPTTEQIEALRAEAGTAGDLAQAQICDRALSGDAIALADCARVIRASQTPSSPRRTP